MSTGDPRESPSARDLSIDEIDGIPCPDETRAVGGTPLRAPGSQGEEEPTSKRSDIYRLAFKLEDENRTLRSHLSDALQQLAEKEQRIRELEGERDEARRREGEAIFRQMEALTRAEAAERDSARLDWLAQKGARVGTGEHDLVRGGRLYWVILPDGIGPAATSPRAAIDAARHSAIPRPPDGTTGGITDEPHDRE